MYHQLSNNILNNIFKYCPNYKCRVCLNKLTVDNMHEFFNYPPHLHNYCYCSWRCLHYI